MTCYLFVHFREKTTPDGEQVHFALSRDGFHWSPVNAGQPVLWAYYGDRGVRDMTILRAGDAFHIFATDLSLSYGMRGRYAHSWDNISRHGSEYLAHWESKDLVHWTEEELIRVGDGQFGCLWAPDIIKDDETGDYILHFSASHAGDDYASKAIYCIRTADFRAYSQPELLYRKPDSGCIDSAMYREDGLYYLFVKSESNPQTMIELVSRRPTGPFERIPRFDEAMAVLESGQYEAPTAVQLDDGRWCLFLDYYGRPGKYQGYIPLVAPRLSDGAFERCDAAFSFPYGFKHGTILPITEAEYERVRDFDWSDVPDLR